MARLDTAGTYRGKIIESTVNTTKASNFPQWVARLLATEKWVESQEELTHFEMDEPGWVDWSPFEEETVAFMVLFKSEDQFDEETALLNYEQLQLATGWDGTEFDTLANDSLIGKIIQFRVQEDEYNGQTKLKVEWVDASDADPVRSLKKIDADGLKGLNAKLKVNGKKNKAKPAAAKPGKAKPGKPGKAAGGQSAPKTSNTESSSETSTAEPSSSPPSTSTQEPQTSSESDEQQEESSVEPPAEMEQLEAWEFVQKHKGETADGEIEQAWISACEAVAPEKDEEDYSKEEWAQVAGHVIQALGLAA